MTTTAPSGTAPTPGRGPATPDPPASDPPQDAGRVSLLLGTLFGLAVSGSSAAAVVLPTTAADLGVERSAAAWVLSGYAVMLAVFTPVFGRIADQVGIRAPFVTGLLAMSAGALASAVATTPAVLITARFVQGAGAASITVLAAALISARYSGQVRAAALGRVAGIGAALSAAAPLLGGALENQVGWRPVMALPAVALLLVPALARLAPREGGGGRFDLPGAVYVTATAGGAVLLAQAPSGGAAIAVPGALLVLAGLPLLVRHVRRSSDGFLPRRVVTDRGVLLPAVAGAGLPAAWFAMLFALPTTLALRGWSPLTIGAAMVPAAAVALLATRTARPVLGRLGTRRTLAAAAAVAVCALLLAALGQFLSSPVLLVVAFTAVALAFSHGQPAMLAQVSAATGEEVRGIALGIATLVFLVGGAVGSALVGGLDGVVPGWAVLLVTAAVPVAGLAAALLGPRPGAPAAPRPASRA